MDRKNFLKSVLVGLTSFFVGQKVLSNVFKDKKYGYISIQDKSTWPSEVKNPVRQINIKFIILQA